MTDDAAFLEQIAENPDELGPRLRYADFLDERRDADSLARAEFIRVQCALGRLPENDPSYPQLRNREHDLLESNWRAWLRPICQALGEPMPVPPLKRTWGEWFRRRLRDPDFADPAQFELHWHNDPRDRHTILPTMSRMRTGTYFLGAARFEEGFVAAVHLLAHAGRGSVYLDRLFERTPLARLTLVNFDRGAMAHSIARGWLRRLRHLGLSTGSSHILSELIDARDANGLRSFDLRTPRDMSSQMLLLLAAATALQPVEVGLRGLDLTPAALHELAGSPFLARAERLILQESNLDDEALAPVLQQTGIEELEIVGPSRSPLERQVVRRLRERFPNLRIKGGGASR